MNIFDFFSLKQGFRFFLLISFLSGNLSFAADSHIVSITEKEIAKRELALKKSEQLIVKAKRAKDDKNLELAYTYYVEALDIIPQGQAMSSQRATTVLEFSKTALEYANYLVSHGKFDEAERVAKTILSPQINPNYKPAAQFLSNLEQPNYFNRTVTPQFAEKKNQLATFLNQAEGYFSSGRYDLALKRYEQVLNLDPYNAAARAGMENVNKQRTIYYDSAYNETRSRMLWLADRSWEKPVRKIRSLDRSTEGNSSRSSASIAKDAITRKLNNTIIEKMDLQDASIREVVDFLKQKSREIDTSTDDPKKRGVNIVLKLGAKPPESASTPTSGTETTPPISPEVTEDNKVTISLNNVPLIEAIRYLTELAGLKYKIEQFAVSILPTTENTDELLTKEYRVSPAFIPANSGAEISNAPQAGPKSADGSNVRLTGRSNATEYLRGQGVPFPTGAFAQYIPSGSKLVVRNTQGNIDLIDTLVEGDMGVAPTQVEIESKFVEISQNNVNELGFDWLLGPFSIGGGVYGNGGSRNAAQELSGEYYNNYSFSDVGQNPVTAGNRSGIGTSANSAITANSLNALLAGVPQGVNVASPGIFGLAGVFTNPQFQVIIRALNQKKGIDLMSAPKVTTKSGNKATIKIAREFPYPTDFSPPQVPQAQTSSSGGNNNTPGENRITVTGGTVAPSTPTTFAKRDIGVTLEVEPQVGADNYTIDLSLAPEVVEFDGFVNYGSEIKGPRYAPATILAGNPSGIETFVITPNTINQPVFSVRKVKTSVSIWDGQTVALGGLIREDIQKVNDKVPLLGDIPLAGRLFRSNVDQKIKKNLIVFVTARLMNAEGQPLKQEDEGEESVDSLGLPEDLPPPMINTRSTGK
jgi:general secretion pathway protein D